MGGSGEELTPLQELEVQRFCGLLVRDALLKGEKPGRTQGSARVTPGNPRWLRS